MTKNIILVVKKSSVSTFHYNFEALLRGTETKQMVFSSKMATCHSCIWGSAAPPWGWLTLARQAVTSCYKEFVAAGLFQHLRQCMNGKSLHFLAVSDGTFWWVCHIGIIQLPIQIWQENKKSLLSVFSVVVLLLRWGKWSQITDLFWRVVMHVQYRCQDYWSAVFLTRYHPDIYRKLTNYHLLYYR